MDEVLFQMSHRRSRSRGNHLPQFPSVLRIC